MLGCPKLFRTELTITFTDVVIGAVLVAFQALGGKVDEAQSVRDRGVDTRDVWDVALHAPSSDANLPEQCCVVSKE